MEGCGIQRQFRNRTSKFDFPNCKYIQSKFNLTQYNMNSNNSSGDYRSKDELNNQFFNRDYQGPKRNSNHNSNNNMVNMNQNFNSVNNNSKQSLNNNNVQQQPRKLPFGGKVPFAYSNKDRDGDDEGPNQNFGSEANDVDMNFKDNAGDGFFRKMKSNLDKDPVIFEEPEEKKEKS
jgi:hypothetical protein